MQTTTGNLQIIGNKVELINNNCGKLKFYKKNFKINDIIEEEDDTTEDDDDDDDKEKNDSRTIIDDFKNYGINNNKLKKIREAVSIREIVGFLSGQQGYRGRLPPLLPPLLPQQQQQQQEQAASLHPLQTIATKSSHIYQEHFGKYYQQLNDLIINGKLMSSPLSSSSSLME